MIAKRIPTVAAALITGLQQAEDVLGILQTNGLQGMQTRMGQERGPSLPSSGGRGR